MNKQILKYVVIGFAVIGLLTTVDTVWSVFYDYGKIFVVTRTEDYTEGKSVLGGGLYDNRSQVTLKEDRGHGAIRTLHTRMNSSFRPGDRVSFDLLGSPQRR